MNPCISFLSSVLLAAIPLSAQELLTNGGFETGDFTGWTTAGAVVINDGGLVAGGTGAVAPPLGGQFDALTNGLGPGLQSFSQMVAIPAGIMSAQLSWSDQINNAAAVFSDPNQEFRVSLRDSAGALISEVFSTNPGDALTQPATDRVFDVTADLVPFAGQMVEVLFEEEDDLFFFNLFLDNCSLLVATNPGGFAGFSTYGSGCGEGSGSSFYEVFDGLAGSPMDLQGGGITLVTTGGPYLVIGPNTPFVMPTTPDLGFGDDEIRNILLPTTGSWAGGFVHATGTVTSLDVESNGAIFLEPGALADFTPTLPEIFGGPARLAVFNTDLNPTVGGTIHAEQDPTDPNVFHVTWLSVPNFGGTAIVDMQASFDVAGMTIEFKYTANHTADGNPDGGIVGYSPGGGVVDPGPRDLDVDAGAGFVNGNDARSIRFDSLNNDRPVLGTVFDLEVSDLPPTAAGGALLLFTAPQDPGIDLGLIGATGCDFLVAGVEFVTLPIGPGGPTQNLSIDLTNAGSSLAGLQLFGQAVILGVPNVEPLGLGLSNGGIITVDAN